MKELTEFMESSYLNIVECKGITHQNKKWGIL